MKISLDINSEYKEPEIRICCDKVTQEISDLQNLLTSILLEKINVYKNYETKSVAIHEIVRIYSENKKVYLRTSDDTYEVKERLYILEEKLRDRGFVRISNTEIVNIASIEKLDMTYVGTIKIYFKNNDTSFVSRRYIGRMKEALKQEKKR